MTVLNLNGSTEVAISLKVFWIYVLFASKRFRLSKQHVFLLRELLKTLAHDIIFHYHLSDEQTTAKDLKCNF